MTVVCFALISSSCAANGVVEGRLNEEFSLHIGQSAYIAGENLKIEFLEIVEDSRCPKDVTCIWAGRAVASVRITYGCPAQELLLTQPGLTDQYSKEDFQHYQLSYRVQPYPEQGEKIPEDQYRLLLIVSK